MKSEKGNRVFARGHNVPPPRFLELKKLVGIIFKTEICFSTASARAKAHQKFWLEIPLDGIVVTIFVLHSFPCFNDLKLGKIISMAPTMVLFDLNAVIRTLPAAKLW